MRPQPRKIWLVHYYNVTPLGGGVFDVVGTVLVRRKTKFKTVLLAGMRLLAFIVIAVAFAGSNALLR